MREPAHRTASQCLKLTGAPAIKSGRAQTLFAIACGAVSSRAEALAARERADSAEARVCGADEVAAGLREQLRAVEEVARGATDAAGAELRRERELASDVALNLQAQIGELKQHAAQVRELHASLPVRDSRRRIASWVCSSPCGVHAQWLESSMSGHAGLRCALIQRRAGWWHVLR